jgi:hypothetical protein
VTLVNRADFGEIIRLLHGAAAIRAGSTAEMATVKRRPGKRRRTALHFKCRGSAVSEPALR